MTSGEGEGDGNVENRTVGQPSFPPSPWTERVVDRLLAGDLWQRVARLLLIGGILYGTIIALDVLVLRPYLGDVLGEPHDLDIYRFRAQSILDGRIPYVDFYSESPPLIMYILTLPQMAGGSKVAYQLCFSAFGVLTALALYLGLRGADERRSMMAALAYLFFPLCLLEFGVYMQDEGLTTFLFLLPLVLLYRERGLSAGIVTLVGVFTKMFNVLLVPWMVLRTGGDQRRGLLLGCLGLGLALTVPFLILFPDQLPSFEFYFLGDPKYPTGRASISPWHYLGQLGYGLPGWAGAALTVGGVLGATLLAYRSGMSLWQGATLVVLAFFLCYPKVLMAYFIMPVALLMMWGLEDRRIMFRLLLMLVPLFLSVALTGNGVDPLADEAWVWLSGMGLSMLGWGLLLHAWWLTRARSTFFERAERDAS